MLIVCLIIFRLRITTDRPSYQSCVAEKTATVMPTPRQPDGLLIAIACPVCYMHTHTPCMDRTACAVRCLNRAADVCEQTPAAIVMSSNATESKIQSVCRCAVSPEKDQTVRVPRTEVNSICLKTDTRLCFIRYGPKPYGFRQGVLLAENRP